VIGRINAGFTGMARGLNYNYVNSQVNRELWVWYMSALVNDKIHRQMYLLMKHREELYRAIRYNGTDLAALVARQEAELAEMISKWEEEK
jgi:hypothetical protein